MVGRRRRDAEPTVVAHGNSLIASAAQVTARRLRSKTMAEQQGWQQEGWEFYDTIGELRYAVDWIGRALSRATLTPCRVPARGEQPEVLEEQDTPIAHEVLEAFAGGTSGQSQLLHRLAVHLSVPGDSYLVGEDELDANGVPTGEQAWRVRSTEEVTVRADDILIDDGSGPKALPDTALVLRVWAPHPRRYWEADSAVRAVLPVLRQIAGFGKHIDATVDSRLAGAGLLVVPNEVSFVRGPEASEEEGDDQFMSDLIDAMVSPITDRDSAAAVVPVLIKVPGEHVDKVKHLSFGTQFDSSLEALLDKAIRRLALGLNLPPEVLLGMAESNHWCLTEGAEVFTRRGWTNRPQIGDEALSLDHETGQATWRPVVDLYEAEVIDEPMRQLRSRTHESTTTLHHRWPTLTPWGARRWRTSAELSATDGITTGAPCRDLPEQPKWSDALVEVAAWFWTEGNIGQSVSIAQSHTVNPGRVARIRAALSACFGSDGFTEYIQRNETSHGGPVTVFRLRAWAGRELLQIAPGKRVLPEFIDALTLAQLRLFIDTSCEGDGHHWRTGERDIWQRDPEALDAYERACILAGYAVSRQAGHDGGTVVRALRTTRVVPVKAAEQAERSGVGGATDEVIAYSGRVWCPVVDGTSSFLAREAGRTFYTGNSAWQIDEASLKLHVQPLLSLICDALTEGYYRPALRAAGVADPEAYMVWFDTTELQLRPNRSTEAKVLFDSFAIDFQALRESSGFEDSDAPSADELRAMILLRAASSGQLDAPMLKALLMSSSGALPGVQGQESDEPETALQEAIAAVDAAVPAVGPPAPAPVPPDPAAPPGSAPPATIPTQRGALTAAARPGDGLLDAAEVLVLRALERAGNKRRSRADAAAMADIPEYETHRHLTVTLGDADRLLAGAWSLVGPTARRHGVQALALQDALNLFTRELLLAGASYDRGALGEWLAATL